MAPRSPRQRLLAASAVLFLAIWPSATESYSPHRRRTPGAARRQLRSLGAGDTPELALGELPDLYPTPEKQPCLHKLAWSYVWDRSKGIEHVERRFDKPGWSDSVPTPYPAPSGAEVTFCMTEKSGSTSWKQLLFKALGKVDFIKPHNQQLTPPGQEAWPPRNATLFKEMVLDPLRPRFMFVRNPFIRLLSAYLSKIGKFHGKWTNTIMWGSPAQEGELDVKELGASPEDFARFVRDMDKRVRSKGILNSGLNPHFRPCSLLCGVNFGFEYDFVLKVEELDEWYPELVQYLGLQGATESGWMRARGIEPETEMAASAGDCFYHAENETCQEVKQRLLTPPKCGVTGTDELVLEPESIAESYHRATGADTKLGEYYTKELIDLVKNIYWEDIRRYDYPVLQL